MIDFQSLAIAKYSSRLTAFPRHTRVLPAGDRSNELANAVSCVLPTGGEGELFKIASRRGPVEGELNFRGRQSAQISIRVSQCFSVVTPWPRHRLNLFKTL